MCGSCMGIPEEHLLALKSSGGIDAETYAEELRYATFAPFPLDPSICAGCGIAYWGKTGRGKDNYNRTLFRGDIVSGWKGVLVADTQRLIERRS